MGALVGLLVRWGSYARVVYYELWSVCRLGGAAMPELGIVLQIIYI